jgi:hypothetical protein
VTNTSASQYISEGPQLYISQYSNGTARLDEGKLLQLQPKQNATQTRAIPRRSRRKYGHCLTVSNGRDEKGRDYLL